MSEISISPGLSISATGLDAESRRMEIIANNVANSQTTRGADGQVFKRKVVVFEQLLENEFAKNGEPGGVKIADVVQDPTPGRRVYRPGHPDAAADGYLEMPNVNPVAEMVDMMSASRAFEANLSAMKTTKAMTTKAIGILSAN
jgi:flagellar basal-body rod protein FlgC